MAAPAQNAQIGISIQLFQIKELIADKKAGRVDDSFMVTIGMNYKVLPGKEEVFERAFEKVIQALRAAPGHSESHLYREVAAERNYLIVSEWGEKRAFDQFIGSDEFRKVVTWGKEQILAGPPQHRIFNHNP